MDTFSHTYNTQRENANAIFTGEKLDKSDELVDSVKNLTINNAKYYESNTATASDAQGDLTLDPETVTHTSNGNEPVTRTSNRHFEQKLLSNRTIPAVVPTMNPRIYQNITPILLTPQTLLTPATKEVIADTASGGAWDNRTTWQVRRTGVNRITPGNICNAVIVKNDPSLVLIGIVVTFPPCVLDAILKVANKEQSTSPTLVGKTQKLDVVYDGNFPDNMDYASVFSKVIGHKLSYGSSGDLYLRCRINFVAGVFQTQTPQFMDIGFSTIISLDEISGISTPTTSTQRPRCGSHWRATDHVFGEVTAVGMSEEKSDHNYNHKTEFQI